MNTLPKNKAITALGGATALAGALLLAAIVIPADPLGRAIGALIAASLAVGLAGILFSRLEFPSGSLRRDPRSDPLPERYPVGPVARLTLVDATAWRFEDVHPDFAAVVSLTEARVARRPEPERHEVSTA